MTIRIDFETRSKVSLDKVGTWMYARHPSTEVLCVFWKYRSLNGFWNRSHPGIQEAPLPTMLFRLIRENILIEAHNALFEWAIWNFICAERMGWPTVPDRLWRCSAAKASACSLPRALGNAGNALQLTTVKDEEEGRRTLLKVTKPVKKTGQWNEDPTDIYTVWKYNQTDVFAEEALSNRIPALSPYEQEIWGMDQRMNRRGIACDIDGVHKAIRLAEHWAKVLNERVEFLTDGLVDRGTKRQKILSWLQVRGVDAEDTQAATLEQLIADPDTGSKEREVMQIVRSVGRSSIRKYQTMINRADKDGRIRDTMMYHGASTGRWAGKGVQPHNFPRGGLKDMEQAWRFIHDEDLEMIQLIYGDPMKFLSFALRGALWAPPGKRLYCADYAAIEARVLLWLAGDDEGLAIFRRDEDIYLDMASVIYGRTITKENTEARQLGKQAILGLGFGMGFVKYLVTCRGYGMYFSSKLIHEIVPAGWYQATAKWIRQDAWKKVVLRMIPDATESLIPELTLMKYVVDKYRQRFAIVCAGWYDLERAAISALNDKGKTYTSMRTEWRYDDEYFPALKCHLPSGRHLWYPYAEIRITKDDRDREPSPKLTYMTVDSKTYQWVRVRTYGAKLAENITQATARDVMADAMLRLDMGNIYSVIMSVHDEIVSETEKDAGSLEEYSAIVSENPKWASGLPIKVEAWTGRRYRK